MDQEALTHYRVSRGPLYVTDVMAGTELPIELHFLI